LLPFFLTEMKTPSWSHCALFTPWLQDWMQRNFCRLCQLWQTCHRSQVQNAGASWLTVSHGFMTIIGTFLSTFLRERSRESYNCCENVTGTTHCLCKHGMMTDASFQWFGLILESWCSGFVVSFENLEKGCVYNALHWQYIVNYSIITDIICQNVHLAVCSALNVSETMKAKKLWRSWRWPKKRCYRDCVMRTFIAGTYIYTIKPVQ
jgi:hypothetical protein